MELDHLRCQYCALNPIHLSDDELDHELQVRHVDIHGESRTKQQRELRALLKAEKDKKTVEYKQYWIKISDELSWCDEKLTEVKKGLEGRKARKAPDQIFKTKLLHIFFRMVRLKEHAKEEADLDSIARIAGECVRLLSLYFSLSSPLPEVREAELTIINESLRQAREGEVDPPTEPVQTSQNESQERLSGENREESTIGEDEEQLTESEKDVEGNELAEVDENSDRFDKLTNENEQLKIALNQLLQRMKVLEASVASKEPNITKQIKASNSTQVDDSMQSKKDVKNKQNFYDWMIGKCSSLGSGIDKVQFPPTTHRTEDDRKEKSQVEVESKPKSSRLPVYKWSVRYDGMDNGRRLNEFLKEVEFNARSEGFTEAELFLSAHHLFTRKARAWFMEVNSSNELGTWEDLVRELKNEFLPVDIDYQYERQLSARRQGPREKFQDYYLDMVRIFRGMSKQWDDDRKFDVLFRNTREDCRTAMLAANVTSIPKMREFGKKYDSINWQMYHRKEKFNRPVSQVEEVHQENRNRNNNGNFKQGYKNGYQGRNFNPNHKPGGKQNFQGKSNGNQSKDDGRKSYQKAPSKPDQQSSQSDEPKAGPSDTNALKRIVNAYIPVRRDVCFNCHGYGHKSQNCTKERQTFCEECGFPGFPTNNCPFCQSKNAKKTAQ